SSTPGKCARAGETIRMQISSLPGLKVLGPIPAFRKKRRNQHIFLLLVKAPRRFALGKVLDWRRMTLPGVRVDVDIDPVEVL
ncbi:MAG: hypothetical protein ABIK62_01495, partial [candidate division WOR-3 bacterium]